MPDLIRIRPRTARKRWPEVGLMVLPHRTGSVWPKPDTVSQNQVGPGLVFHSMIRAVYGRTQPSLKVGNSERTGCVLPEPGQTILVHQLFSGPDTFGPNLARPSRSVLGRFCTIWSRYGLLCKNGTELMREVGPGIYDPAQFWSHAGRNFHN